LSLSVSCSNELRVAVRPTRFDRLVFEHGGYFFGNDGVLSISTGEEEAMFRTPGS
jgi:hypothetical protein